MKKFYLARNFRSHTSGLTCALKLIDGGKAKTVMLFSLVFATVDGGYVPIPENFAAEKRAQVEWAVLFLNSEECTEELCVEFVSSILSPNNLNQGWSGNGWYWQ